MPRIDFKVQKINKKEPLQLIEVRNPKGKITPAGFRMTVDQIADKMWSNMPIVFKLGDKLPGWAMGMLFLGLETVVQSWVGICRDKPHYDVVVISTNLQNVQVGNTIPFATLGLEIE